MRAFLNNKKYYDNDGNYLNLNQIQKRDQKFKFRKSMSNNENVLPEVIQNTFFRQLIYPEASHTKYDLFFLLYFPCSKQDYTTRDYSGLRTKKQSEKVLAERVLC